MEVAGGEVEALGLAEADGKAEDPEAAWASLPSKKSIKADMAAGEAWIWM